MAKGILVSMSDDDLDTVAAAKRELPEGYFIGVPISGDRTAWCAWWQRPTTKKGREYPREFKTRRIGPAGWPKDGVLSVHASEIIRMDGIEGFWLATSSIRVPWTVAPGFAAANVINKKAWAICFVDTVGDDGKPLSLCWEKGKPFIAPDWSYIKGKMFNLINRENGVMACWDQRKTVFDSYMAMMNTIAAADKRIAKLNKKLGDEPDEVI